MVCYHQYSDQHTYTFFDVKQFLKDIKLLFTHKTRYINLESGRSNDTRKK